MIGILAVALPLVYYVVVSLLCKPRRLSGLPGVQNRL